MNESDRLIIFKAQTENVRKLNQVRKHLIRSINNGLRRNKITSVDVHTKCLALVFCAWVEANFSKLIHTPHGFTLDEIEQIKRENSRSRSVESAWQKAVELGLRYIESSPKSNFLPNRKQEMLRLVQTHVVEPSLLRNKIAHGQWEKALNRESTAVNEEVTVAIHKLDVITLDRWFKTHQYLAQIIEALIESPNMTFHRDYWHHVTKLNEYLEETQDWTLEQKREQLSHKPEKREQC